MYEPERIRVDCPRCQREMLTELRVIRNLALEPEIVTEIRQGTIFTFVCGHCHNAIQVPHALLIYHPAKLPAMLFIPVPGSSRRDSQWAGGDLAQLVRAAEAMTEPAHIAWGELNAVAPIIDQWMTEVSTGGVAYVPEQEPSNSGDEFGDLLETINRRLDSTAGYAQRIQDIETSLTELDTAYGRHDESADERIRTILPILRDLRVALLFSWIEELLDPERGADRPKTEQALALATALEAETEGKDWAKARVYHGTAEYQRQLFAGGKDFTAAIAIAESAVPTLRAEMDHTMLAVALNNLALMCYRQHFAGDADSWIEQAIDRWREALDVIEPSNRMLRASALSNLEMAYDARISGEPAENDELSLDYAEQALATIDREQNPNMWAMVHNNLGFHYLTSEIGDRYANLERSKAELELAATVLRSDTTPTEWAKLQANLGACFQQRVAGNRADNIEQALICFGNALTVQRPEDNFAEWAQSQLGFATSLLERDIEPVDQFEQQAIDMIGKVLELIVGDPDGKIEADCHLHLGTLYAQRVNTGAIDFADVAIEHYTKASVYYSRQRHARHWGMMQSGLSLINAKKAQPDIAKALVNAESAITSIDRSRYPFEWGIAQLNKAIVHQIHDDPEHAIIHCRLALETLTVERAPNYCARAASVLGECHAEADQWPETAEAFSLAVTAFDYSYDESVRASARATLLGQASVYHTSAAYALVRCGEPARAITFAEAGRSFALRESLELDPTTVDPSIDQTSPEYQRYIAALATLRAAEAAMRAPELAHARVTGQQARLADEHRLAERESARRSAAEARARLARPRRADLATICEYTADSAAVCYVLSSPWGTAMLTVLPAEGTVGQRQHPLTHNELSALLFTTTEPRRGSGLLYGAMVGGDAIQQAIEVFARSAVAGWLREYMQGHAEIMIVPMGLWSVVPFSLVVPGVGITYAASAEIRHRCQTRAAQPTERRPGVLAYADSSLRLAGAEVEAVMAAFDDGVTIPARPAAKDELVAQLSHFRHLHLATHGIYALAEPMDSAILVGGRQLVMRELVEQQLLTGVRLAFLSACQSGMTDVLTRRDEVIGLPSACIYSGAIGVVATLWPVDDAATFLFVRRFYQEYRMDEPARALARTQIWLREVSAAEILAELPHLPAELSFLRFRPPGSKPFLDPVFWAPFVYVGA